MAGKVVFSRFMLAAAVMLLAGCETMDTTMSKVGDTFANMKLPAIGKAAAGQGPAPESAAAVTMVSQPVDCPRVGIVDDLDSLHQFTEGAAPTAENAISSVKINQIDSLCSINDTNVVVDMDIHVSGKLGPRGKLLQADKPSFAYPYFIAITTPNGNITAKEVFAATITYEGGAEADDHIEQMRQVIPLSGDYVAKDYEILVGFQLTPQELEYNRQRGESAAAMTPAAGQ